MDDQGIKHSMMDDIRTDEIGWNQAPFLYMVGKRYLKRIKKDLIFNHLLLMVCA